MWARWCEPGQAPTALGSAHEALSAPQQRRLASGWTGPHTKLRHAGALPWRSLRTQAPADQALEDRLTDRPSIV